MTLEKSWRGRDMFHRLKPMLSTFATALGCLPLPVRKWLLTKVRRPDGYVAMVARWALLRSIAPTCGDNVAIYADVHIHNPSNLHLGSNIKIGEMSFMGSAGGITIEDDVSIAHGCSLLTEFHDISIHGPVRDTPVGMAPIRLKEGSLVGAGCRILGGVTVGEYAIVGAGSVVTRDVPPYAVVAGVPAQVLRYRQQTPPEKPS